MSSSVNSALTSLAECAVQSVCGGCPLMPLPTLRQHAVKRERLTRAFETNGVSLPRIPIEITAGPAPVGYRNRIRLRIESDGQVRFFNEQKIEGCAVLEPRLRERLQSVLALSSSRPELFAGFRHLELRSDDLLGRPALALAGDAPSLELRERSRELARELRGFLTGLRGDPEIPWQKRGVVDRVTNWVPLDGFIQVNSAVNALLVAALRGGALDRRVTTVLDLYAGAGNFSLSLAASGLRVFSVELHASSVRALAVAAREQKLAVEALAGAATTACSSLAEANRVFDLVIVDAPRAGARECIHALLPLAARAVALCSCNPVSLARDVAELVNAGFELEETRMFDMFPQTEHVEVLAWLSRR